MNKLVYSALASLDGYVEDADGAFDWAAPDDEVHAFVKPEGVLSRRSPQPRAAGRTPLRQRHRLPSLPRLELS